MTRKRARRLPRLHDIEAIVFDLDGVLVDSEPIHFRAANRVLAGYGAAIDEAEYRTFIGLGETATWLTWRERSRIPESVAALIVAHTTARLQEIAAGVDAIAAAVDLVRQLHATGMRLAIASSSTPQIIDALLLALGLNGVFSVRISGEDPEVQASKPAPDVYLAAAARLGVAQRGRELAARLGRGGDVIRG